MKIWLIRHGQTEGNLKRLYYGSTDIPLCDQGRLELKALREKEIYPSPEKVYVTDLIRTKETANILFGDVPQQECPLLREMDFGVFEMQAYEHLKDRADYQHWLSGAFYLPATGGESIDAFVYRVRAGFDQLLSRCAAQGITEAVAVLHGGVIATMTQIWFPGEQNFYQWLPACGRGYVITMDQHQKPLEWMAV